MEQAVDVDYQPKEKERALNQIQPLNREGSSSSRTDGFLNLRDNEVTRTFLC